MSRKPFDVEAAMAIDYETFRPAWPDAGPWDRTVREVRARDQMRRRGADRATLVVDKYRDGGAVLVDPDDPANSEPL